MRIESRRMSGFWLAAFSCLAPARLAAQAPPPPPGPAAAKADDNPLGWTAKAALSYVGTGGNAEASTLGLKFKASYNRTRTFFSLSGGGVRADSTTTGRFAIGPAQDDFTVVEVEDKKKTAENYFLDGTLDRNLTSRLFWQTGAGFLRNTFAGVDSRLAARAGVGYVFTDPAGKGASLKGALLATLTHQSEVVDDPTTDDTFVGVRAILDFATKFGTGARSSFTSRLAVDQNLQSTDDLRAAWLNALGVSMTDRLGLEVGLLLSYDHLPALTLVDRYGSSSGPAPVGSPLGSVLVPLGKWDREVTVSVVVNLAPKKPATTTPPPPPAAPAK